MICKWGSLNNFQTQTVGKSLSTHLVKGYASSTVLHFEEIELYHAV